MVTTTIDRTETAWGLAPGDSIARGLVALELLGGGSRYEAYLAFDERLLHTVVAKVLRPDRVDDDGALRGLRSEAEVLGSLNHPAIARLLRSGIDEERPHLVLEHVEGPRLSTLIRRFGPLETEQAAPLAVEVASALHYLHGREVVHLDVKPKNLIMGGPPRLIDLSIARPFGAAAALDAAVGTDAYMAPEQVDVAPGRVGSAADVWGLGVTLYEAIAGKPAFPAGTREETASLAERYPQLTAKARPLPEHVAAELRQAVTASMAFEPSERPSAAEVAEVVEPLLRRPRRLVLNRLKPR
jgi:serine/threonine protein kinase